MVRWSAPWFHSGKTLMFGGMTDTSVFQFPDLWTVRRFTHLFNSYSKLWPPPVAFIPLGTVASKLALRVN